MIILKCVRCGTGFNGYPSSIKKGAKFCSKQCMNNYKNENKISNIRMYRTWINMRSRCYNKKNASYKHYGEKGITYDPRWDDFNVFYEEMKYGYADNLTIDRIDNSKGYYKENCQWITMEQQNKKHSKCIFYEFNGEKLNLTDIAKKIGVRPNTLHARFERGWSLEKVINTPIKR